MATTNEALYMALPLVNAQDHLHARSCPVRLPVMGLRVDGLTDRLTQGAGIRSFVSGAQV